MLGSAYTMVGYAVLWEVISSDLFTTVAATDLRQSGLAIFFLLLLGFEREQSGSQHAHGLKFIFKLAFLVLAGHNQAGGQVSNAHG